jgi:peptidyl-prolyl cis-trans isomerase D
MAQKTSNKLTPSKIFLWLLMGMLFVGLAGFGATNFGGGLTRIGSVGDKPILVQDYYNGLQQDIRAISQQFGTTLTFEQAQMFGVPQQTLSRLVTTRAFDNETFEIGLSVGDETLAEELRQIPNFNGEDGFDRNAYSFILENAGLTEAEFEATLRDETARTLLQTSIVAGTSLRTTYAETMLKYQLERRSVTMAELTDADLVTTPPLADEATLRAYYDANIDQYTSPEARDVTYAWITPDMLLDSVQVPEEDLRSSYDERYDEFNLPERRLVEQLVFPDDAEAQAALSRIGSGGSFEEEVAGRGLALADTDLGDVTRESLNDAGAIVFDAQVGDVAGPAPSAFGPALFRINAILPAQAISFDDAREALRRDLGADQARRQVAVLAEEAINELAAGATVEDLPSVTALVDGQIIWTEQTQDGIAAYPAFSARAQQAQASDFPEIFELGDGGVFALQLNAIIPPAPIPFEDILQTVAQDQTMSARADALMSQAEDLAAQLQEGVEFAGLGLSTENQSDLLRTDFLPQLTRDGMGRVFEMSVGQVRALNGANGVVVLRLDGVNTADLTDENAAQRVVELTNQASTSVAEDLFNALSVDIQLRAGIEIDQAAIDAVHVNFQ